MDPCSLPSWVGMRATRRSGNPFCRGDPSQSRSGRHRHISRFPPRVAQAGCPASRSIRLSVCRSGVCVSCIPAVPSLDRVGTKPAITEVGRAICDSGTYRRAAQVGGSARLSPARTQSREGNRVNTLRKILQGSMQPDADPAANRQLTTWNDEVRDQLLAGMIPARGIATRCLSIGHRVAKRRLTE